MYERVILLFKDICIVKYLIFFSKRYFYNGSNTNCHRIFLAGVESVKPDNLIKRYISINQNALQIEEITFDLSIIKNIYVVSAGKASAAMAQTMESILGYRTTGGHIITKYNHTVPLKLIEITEAGHTT